MKRYINTPSAIRETRHLLMDSCRYINMNRADPDIEPPHHVNDMAVKSGSPGASEKEK